MPSQGRGGPILQNVHAPCKLVQERESQAVEQTFAWSSGPGPLGCAISKMVVPTLPWLQLQICLVGGSQSLHCHIFKWPIQTWNLWWKSEYWILIAQPLLGQNLLIAQALAQHSLTCTWRWQPLFWQGWAQRHQCLTWWCQPEVSWVLSERCGHVKHVNPQDAMVHCPRFLYDSSAVGSCSLTCRGPNIEATVWPQAILHWCVCVVGNYQPSWCCLAFAWLPLA